MVVKNSNTRLASPLSFYYKSFSNFILILPNHSTRFSNEQIFWYKAESHSDFKLGSKEFWELSKNLNSDDEDDVYDPNSSKKRGSGPRINVKKNKW